MSSRKEQIEKRTEELLAPILENLGFELVDTEYVKEAGTWYLRAYIDKESGITVDDCETVSRALEIPLDAEDLVPEAYILEVSSPGLGRPLKKEKDYARAMGKNLEIRTFRPIAHEKEFYGILTGYDYAAGTVVITTDDGTEMTFDRKDLALIRLAFDF